jgi:hypothetical protein
VSLLHRYQGDLHTEHVTVEERKQLESDPSIVKRFVLIQEQPQVNCMLTQGNVDRRAAIDRRAARDSAESKSEPTRK